MPTNPIVVENANPGNPPDEWRISGAGSDNIRGFATDISVNHGQNIDFKIDTDSTNYRIDIYRLGYYGGNGARRVATIQRTLPTAQVQPDPAVDSSTGLMDYGTWAVSASWAVPADALSGVYIAKLVRQDGTFGESHIPFIVRNDGGSEDVLFQTSDTTWQAYNAYGGNSLYYGAPAGRAYKVSYNRPFITRSGDPGGVSGPYDFLFDSEYPMIRWLEANGYYVGYISGVDTDRRGSELRTRRLFLSVGHDEYWSGQQRANVEAARDAGVHLAFFSGNEVFWKTRWENSIDRSNTPYRTLVCYKETHANAKIDPTPTWTGTWRDPRFSPPSDGGRPENALTGTIFMVNGMRFDTITVSDTYSRLRFWRNTEIANLGPGQSVTLTSNCLGYEWDADLDNGARPAGLVPLSSTTVTMDGAYVLQDYGSTYGPGTVTHELTLYRAASGALVFGSGTIRWSWGLDGTHDSGGSTPDVRMQQATVNLFADMGVQPASLQSGLTSASPSTDTTPPSSTVTSPSAGASVPQGEPVVITGTASDAGGVVGAVEVSVDGGTTWHPAAGRDTWTYGWVPPSQGTVTLRSRAVDDSGNLETPGPGVSVTVTAPTTVSIWSASATPGTPSEPDPNAVEVGVKFRTSVAGTINGIRFYKGMLNTGTHVAHLWSATGSTLASATFTVEAASGWQQVNFTTPAAIQPNTTYVASYFAPNGHYAVDQNYFTNNAVTNGPLTALADGTDGGNGVYVYSTTGGFPTSTFNASNYWVDVAFQAQAQATVSLWSASDTPGTASVADPNAVELGVKFRTSVAGTILGIRFYKGPQNTGTHVAHLWSASGGTPLATATFSNETASGWQQVTFATPVTIQANTTYVASYFAPNGNYAFDQNYFANARTNGPLTALANGTDGGNGVYVYSTTGGFPTSTFNASNYWVDVIFQQQPGA